MEAGDIVNELSTSNIVEDDLNGIFSSLEPLEDPKDDMFFFGGKDLLQKIREKNPANTSVTVHRPNSTNKPMPPPSHVSSAHHTSSGAHISSHTSGNVHDARSSPTAHHDKAHNTGNDTKGLSPAAIASASASAMYLDNYLAASNAKNPPIATVTTVPPPLFPTGHDKSTKAHHHASILRKPAHKASNRNPLSKSHPGYATNSGLSVPTSASVDQKREPHPLAHSTASICNPNLTSSHHGTSHTTPLSPTTQPHSTTTHLSAPNYATPSPPVSKRSKANYLKSSNELKHSRVIYNPNANSSASTLRNTTEIPMHPVPTNTNYNVPTTQSNEAERNYNSLTMSPLPPRSATPTVEPPENAPDKTNTYSAHANINNNNCAYIAPPSSSSSSSNSNSHRVTANVDYFNYGNYSPYFAYHPNIPGYYASHAQLSNETPPEPVYNPRSESQPSFESSESAHAHSNPSNDLYSNLYLYTNTSTYTSRAPPPPDINSSYNNLYNYSNLYMNSLYGYPSYPIRQYPAHAYSKSGSYDPQLYRSTESFEDYDDEDDYRAERSGYSKGHSKRSKRKITEDDEYSRKPSRKSKSRSRSKRNKLPPPYEGGSLLDSSELNTTHTTSMDIPNGEGAASSAFSPPLSPLHNTKRAKANLFENTPKIKIGDVPGGNAKISKLGRKLLETVNLDWQTPYAQDECPRTPVLKSPNDQEATSHMKDESNTTSKSIDKYEEKAEVFIDYDMVPERKTELLYFVANNIESLLTMPTKIEITLHDFKASALGAKVRQRLDVMNTIQRAKDLGLILDDQFTSKQKQFLDAFTFGMGNIDKKST